MLLFKILLAPVLIALVSLAGRKWGPGVSGWLLGIPFNSGPILFFLVLEQGPQFASRTALGSLLGILAWAAFTLTYAYSCLKLPWWYSTIIGWIAYFAVAALILPMTLSILPAFTVVSIVLAVILWAFPKVAPPRAQTVHGQYDLWLRMGTASFMVVTLTGFAKLLGPIASGILSAFPAYTTILAVFNHRHEAAAAVYVLRGVSVGLYTAATFFLILSPALLRLPATAAFGLALTGGLVVHGLSLIYVRRNA
ncbi:MAG TPA: hypothetical protein VKY85_06840 [Candidatus Angelobacter sp.]|nr:hypothetical protein [Candidatus Angelobacter sp.]